MKRTLLPVTVLLTFAIGLFAQNSFKNLASSGSEMDSMRLPDARTLGVNSKAAMLPVRFKDGKATIDIPVESTENLRLTRIAPNSGDWQIIAFGGANKDIDLRKNVEFVERTDSDFGLDGARFPAEVFSFDNVKAGTWRVEITAQKGANLREDETVG